MRLIDEAAVYGVYVALFGYLGARKEANPGCVTLCGSILVPIEIR